MSGPGEETPLAWQPMALLLFVAGGVLLALGLLVRSPVPLFAAVPLLLAPAAAAFDAPRGTASAKLDWRVAGSGPLVEVTGEIRPNGRLSVDALSVEFYRPPLLRERAPPVIEREPNRLRFRLDWEAPYPFLQVVARPTVYWRDPLGLLEVPVRLDAPALRVDRFPPEVARLGTVRLHRTTPQPGEVRSRQVGSAGEFFSVRLAAPTDTPRQINWRATARRGRLLSNDFYLERTGDLLLLLDLRPSSLGAERDQRLLSIARAAAFGIATGFLAEKARVGVGLFGEFLTAVPLGTGRIHRVRIAQALQRAEVAEEGGPSERFAVSLRRYFPPGVSTVLMSPLADDDSLALLTHLRRRGYPTVVLSPSPIPLLVSEGGRRSAEDEVMLRLLRLVRRQRVGEAWREAPVIEWEDYWSLAPFVRFLNRPAANPRGNV